MELGKNKKQFKEYRLQILSASLNISILKGAPVTILIV
jgi:hypothetical protein